MHTRVFPVGRWLCECRVIGETSQRSFCRECRVSDCPLRWQLRLQIIVTLKIN
jgi:hypothetical protein